ncbi:DnaD domain protein [Mesobacillus subterraneus]|uniref:DnaD domain-containing protein n=1 Tax=Mesobacillus subterraneus TaxID=285983 RepID=UPI00203B192C|nr:DnaD domain protein [Mesobacillus subterraneus]MCM3663475.1 DnaD domain protein [Mesobacillus subterraneus]MCM3683245.1 DnaD domain protein [Mesobacillus subterraneus]
MSKLLLDDKPIIVLPSLAEKVGLNEAIFLQQLNYWLQESKHSYEEKKWVYNTQEDWQEQFPFWSISTIRRTISKLESIGLLISGNFNKKKFDRTKWFTINYKKLEGLSKPSVQNEQMHNDAVVEDEDSQGDAFVQNGEMHNDASVQNEQTICSKWTDHVFNLNRPIPEITSESTSEILKEVEEEEEEEEEEEPAQEPKENPFRFFEENGFGMIGGYMSQKIANWCDDLSDDVVLEALKLAVENGSKKWNYVESILRSWAEKKVKTVEDAKALQKAFRDQMSRRRDRSNSGRKPVRKEQPPEWFAAHLQQSAAKQPEPEQLEDFDYEEEKKALEQELKKFKK